MFKIKLLVYAILILFITCCISYAQEIIELNNGVYQIICDNSEIKIDTGGNSTNYHGSIISIGDGNVNESNLCYLAPVFGIGSTNHGIEIDQIDVVEGNTLEIIGHGPQNLNLNNLEVRLLYHPTAEEIELTIEWIAHENINVKHDAKLHFSDSNFDNATFLNTYRDKVVNRNVDLPFETSMQNGMIIESRSINTLISVLNPYHGDFKWDNSGINLRVMRTRIANTPINAEEAPVIHSELSVGDTIRRHLKIRNSVDSFIQNIPLVFPSPHPNGATGTLSLVCDEEPLTRSHWVPMTNLENNTSPIYDKLLRLFEEFPNFKMSFVMLLDPIQYFIEQSLHTDGWYMNPGNLSYTQFSSYDGDRSLRMEVKNDTVCYIGQEIEFIEHDVISISAYLKIPDQLSFGGGFKFQVKDMSDLVISESELFSEVGDWRHIDWASTGIIPVDGNYKICFALYHAGGSVFLDNIAVTASGRNIEIQNQSFESGRTRITYDSDQYSWWDAHSITRMSTEATDEYKEYLSRVDLNNTIYGWEDRLGLGIHGYHHTPVSDIIGSYHNCWEWMYIDSLNQDLIWQAIEDDFVDLGFSEESRKTLRTPGFKFHHQTVQSAIDFGVKWMDDDASHAGMSIYPVYGDSDNLWMHRLCFWGDNPGDHWANLEYTQEVLEVGGSASWGIHPNATFQYGASEERYDWFSSKIRDIGNMFPDAVWELPQDVAERGTQLSGWDKLRHTIDDNTMTITFNGSGEDGITIVVRTPNQVEMIESPFLDNDIELEYIQRGNKLFLILPEIGHDQHTITITAFGINDIHQVNQLPLEPEFIIWPSPTNGLSRVKWSGQKLYGKVGMELYDILGRLIHSETWNSRNHSVNQVVDLNNLPSGIYFIKLENPGSKMIKTSKIVLLK
jgi:Secretion system C-terminal sorting domain